MINFKDFQKTYQKRITNTLDKFYQDKIGQVPYKDKEFTKAIKNLWQFAAPSGKRNRPILALLIYKGVGGQDEDLAVKACISLELMHKFFLIHDDIIDKDLYRWGKPNLVSQYISYFSNRSDFLKFHSLEKLSTDINMILGDLNFNFAFENISRLNIKPRIKDKLFKVINHIVFSTACGWYKEFISSIGPLSEISDKERLQIIELVSARYSFVGPFLFGGNLAEASQDILKKLEQLGLNLGFAFQLQDDLSDYLLTEQVPSDIKNRKKTLIIYFTYQKLSSTKKGIMEKIFNKKEISLGDFLQIKDFAQNTKAFDKVKEQIRKYCKKASIFLTKIELEKDVKKILFDYIEYLKMRDKQVAA